MGSKAGGQDGEEEEVRNEDTTGATHAAEAEQEGNALTEGGNTAGLAWRMEHGVPTDMAARKKWALTPAHQEQFVWETGREYKVDFFNPYLDFNDFSLKLPGLSISVLGFMGGEDYLRYVLRNKETGEVLFVVVFALVKREEYEKEVAAKERKVGKTAEGGEGEGEEGISKGEGKKEVIGDRHEGEKSFVPQSDDLD